MAARKVTTVASGCLIATSLLLACSTQPVQGARVVRASFRPAGRELATYSARCPAESDSGHIALTARYYSLGSDAALLVERPEANALYMQDAVRDGEWLVFQAVLQPHGREAALWDFRVPVDATPGAIGMLRVTEQFQEANGSLSYAPEDIQLSCALQPRRRIPARG